MSEKLNNLFSQTNLILCLQFICKQKNSEEGVHSSQWLCYEALPSKSAFKVRTCIADLEHVPVAG